MPILSALRRVFLEVKSSIISSNDTYRITLFSILSLTSEFVLFRYTADRKTFFTLFR